jgi:hypothetical protein
MLDDVGIIQDVGEGKSKLSALLSGKNMVVVLDDCWELKHADAFPTNVEGSVFLVTTRIKSLLPSATEFQLGRLSDTEGCALLDTGVTDAAIEVLDICTRLPLALAVIGAVHKIGAGLSMVDIASAMRRTTVDADSPNAAAFRALTLGVEQLSPGERSLYVDLAVYPEDVWVPVAVIVRFATSRRSGSAEKNSSAGKKSTPQVGGADEAANEAADEAAAEAADEDPLLMALLSLARRQLLKLKGVPPSAITDSTSPELDPALRQALLCRGAMVGLHDNPSIRYWANMHCANMHCANMHCTDMHCTDMHCTNIHCTNMHCTIMHCTEMHCTDMHCADMHCTNIHYTNIPQVSLHDIQRDFDTVLTCTVLTCTALTYTIPTYPRLVCTISSVTSCLDWLLWLPHRTSCTWRSCNRTLGAVVVVVTTVEVVVAVVVVVVAVMVAVVVVVVVVVGAAALNGGT